MMLTKRREIFYCPSSKNKLGTIFHTLKSSLCYKVQNMLKFRKALEHFFLEIQVRFIIILQLIIMYERLNNKRYKII